MRIRALLTTCSGVALVASCAQLIGLESTSTIDEATAGEGGLIDAGGEGSISPVGDGGSTPDASAPVRCDAPDLVARWNFDEGTGAIAHDCTTNAIDGRLSSAGWGPGQRGQALVVDGGWVVFNPNTLLRIDGAFTITAWVRVARATGATQYVLGKTQGGAQPTRGFRLAVDASRKLSLSLGDGSAVHESTGGPALALRTWIHVAASYAPGSAVKLYVNGGVIVSDTVGVPATIAIASDDLQAGARGDGEYSFAGSIDDLRLYDRVLTGAEIMTIAAP